jgi:peptidoglycan hydrolase-like protein with peptidoglycan-binding domain
VRVGLVPTPRVEPSPDADIFQRRRRLLALGAFALAVVVAIIVAVVATGGGGNSTAVTTAQTTAPVTPPASSSTTPTTATTSKPSLRVAIPAGAGNISAGDSGSAVLTLQKALAALGLDVGTPDGKFGQKTQDALKAFQTAHNLTPDGIVGNDTVRALNEALAAAGR